MNHNINGNLKIHPSTVAVISHSPASWHQRTKNVQYHWHLICIMLCNSSSFVESCFYSFFSSFFSVLSIFYIPCWKIINISSWVHSSTRLWLHVTKREHTNALWDLRKRPFYRVKILKPQAVVCWLQPFIEVCLLPQCMAIIMIFRPTALTNPFLLNEI